LLHEPRRSASGGRKPQQKGSVAAAGSRNRR
jgi:hypothetical protein